MAHSATYGGAGERQAGERATTLSLVCCLWVGRSVGRALSLALFPLHAGKPHSETVVRPVLFPLLCSGGNKEEGGEREGRGSELEAATRGRSDPSYSESNLETWILCW